jgi:hypothetical protein
LKKADESSAAINFNVRAGHFVPGNSIVVVVVVGWTKWLTRCPGSFSRLINDDASYRILLCRERLLTGLASLG